MQIDAYRQVHSRISSLNQVEPQAIQIEFATWWTLQTKARHSVARLGTGSLSDNPADNQTVLANTIGSVLDILLLVNRIVLQKIAML